MSPRRPFSRRIRSTDLLDDEEEERRQEQNPKTTEMRAPKRKFEFINVVIDDCDSSFSGSHSHVEEDEDFGFDDSGVAEYEDELEEITTYDGSSVAGSRTDESEEGEDDKFFHDCEAAGLMVFSKKEKKKYAEKRITLPPKGSEEYKRLRNEDAKRRRDENAKVHKCPYCDYSAPFPNRVKRHIETNHSKDRWKCSYCTETFDTHSAHRAHVSAVHPILHMCDHCGFSGKRPADVRAHIAKNHEQGLKCTVPGCNKTMSKRKLRRHILEYHTKSIIGLRPRAEPKAAKTAKCLQCSMELKDQDDLGDHMKSVHGDEINCPRDGCHKTMKNEELQEHLDQHHGNGSEITSKSPRRAKSALGEETPPAGGSLKTPSPTTSSDEELEEKVSQPSSDEDSSSGELLSKKSESRKPSRRSSAADDAESEKFMKTIDGSYVCLTCEGSYASLYLVKKHIKRIHENKYNWYINRKQAEKKFDCTVSGCNKSFRVAAALEGHINKHNNVFPFSCDHCRQSFFGRDRFAVHLQKYHQTSIRRYNLLQGDISSK